MTKYEKIIEAFAKGEVQGLPAGVGVPERISTVISNVFLFSNNVYKIYKRDAEDFNTHFHDLSNEDIRREFYKHDFLWNNHFSPTVVTSLLGLVERDGVVALTDNIDSADELVICMKRIDAANNVSRMLIENRLTPAMAKQISYRMSKLVDEFPHAVISNQNYYQIMRDRMEDLRNWSYMAHPYLPKVETDSMIEVLKREVDKRKGEFEKIKEEMFVTGLDNHSDNICFVDGEPVFIDIYPPKPAWIPLEPMHNLFRLAADMQVLGGEEYVDAMIEGYKQHHGEVNVDRELGEFYMIYAALIKAVYVHVLGRDEVERDKYFEYVRWGIEKLR